MAAYDKVQIENTINKKEKGPHSSLSPGLQSPDILTIQHCENYLALRFAITFFLSQRRNAVTRIDLHNIHGEDPLKDRIFAQMRLILQYSTILNCDYRDWADVIP